MLRPIWDVGLHRSNWPRLFDNRTRLTSEQIQAKKLAVHLKQSILQAVFVHIEKC